MVLEWWCQYCLSVNPHASLGPSIEQIWKEIFIEQTFAPLFLYFSSERSLLEWAKIQSGRWDWGKHSPFTRWYKYKIYTLIQIIYNISVWEFHEIFFKIIPIIKSINYKSATEKRFSLVQVLSEWGKCVFFSLLLHG